MKKHALFVALAAVAALPACSSQSVNYPYRFNEAQNGQYEAERGGNVNKEWEDKQLNAMVDRFFAKADTNHDGTISWKEFQAYMRHKFHEADTNHDGKLSRDEVMAMLKRHMNRIKEEMREGKQSMQDNGGEDSQDMDSGDDNNGRMGNPPRYNGQE